jgi:hypothetical protein
MTSKAFAADAKHIAHIPNPVNWIKKNEHKLFIVRTGNSRRTQKGLRR